MRGLAHCLVLGGFAVATATLVVRFVDLSGVSPGAISLAAFAASAVTVATRARPRRRA